MISIAGATELQHIWCKSKEHNDSDLVKIQKQKKRFCTRDYGQHGLGPDPIKYPILFNFHQSPHLSKASFIQQQVRQQTLRCENVCFVWTTLVLLFQMCCFLCMCKNLLYLKATHSAASNMATRTGGKFGLNFPLWLSEDSSVWCWRLCCCTN